MDEPLYFGHKYDKQHACRWSIPEIAQNVATAIAAFRQVFPSTEVCDAEPIAIPYPGWVEEIVQWTQAYEASTAQALACFHADVQWSGPWRTQLSALRDRLHASGIQLGIIYNGDGSAQSGAEWTRQSEARFRMVESNPALIPDQALLQSWTRQPEGMLPETLPGTMTHLVLQYLEIHH